MTALIIVLITLASLYVFGIVFVIVAGAMKLTDDSHLVREQGRAQIARAPLWPIDEYQRVKAERTESKRLAHIEQSEDILRKLERVERLQQRNLETWRKAEESREQLHDRASHGDETPSSPES